MMVLLYSINDVIAMELWRSIPGYEGLYEVSDIGNVRSIDRMIFRSKGKPFIKKGKVLRAGTDTNGYYYVSLYKHGIPRHESVHRLVAISFLDNPNKYPIVNHINEDKKDNRPCNLEWCTEKYNTNYGNGISRKVNSRIKNNRPFMCIENGKTYINQNECARELQISQGSIGHVLKGKRKKLEIIILNM